MAFSRPARLLQCMLLQLGVVVLLFLLFLSFLDGVEQAKAVAADDQHDVTRRVQAGIKLGLVNKGLGARDGGLHQTHHVVAPAGGRELGKGSALAVLVHGPEKRRAHIAAEETPLKLRARASATLCGAGSRSPRPSRRIARTA